MGRKFTWISITLCFVVSATLLTWFYFQVDMPHKAPVKAKQVFNIHSGIKVARFNVVPENNFDHNEQIIDRI